MTLAGQRKALRYAAQAARAAGKLLRANARAVKTIASSTQHDIKLELDVRSQELIQKALHSRFPDVALLGEEGVAGGVDAPHRWVVDPIDGTVNFTYGIPHACVSIALQRGVSRQVSGVGPRSKTLHAPRSTLHETLLGVVYDPFQDELWTAIRGQPAKLNGKNIH